MSIVSRSVRRAFRTPVCNSGVQLHYNGLVLYILDEFTRAGSSVGPSCWSFACHESQAQMGHNARLATMKLAVSSICCCNDHSLGVLDSQTFDACCTLLCGK